MAEQKEAIYLLSWYKSTNADAVEATTQEAKAKQDLQGKETGAKETETGGQAPAATGGGGSN